MAVIIRGYYDGSATHEGPHRSITLAGYAATPEKLAELDALWPDVLEGDGTRPAAACLHMTDAYSLRGAFSQENGWTAKHVWSLFHDVARCLSKVGRRSEGAQHTFLGATCTIPLDDYERALAVLPNLRNKEPEAICVNCVTEVALRMLAPIDGSAEVDELKKVGHVEFFFDHNERFLHKINRVWIQPLAPDRPRVLELVGEIKALKDKPPALQAADYLAWMTNRHLRDRDVRCGVFRILSAPMFGFDYTYDRLVQDYKEWNGYLRSGKRRVTRVH